MAESLQHEPAQAPTVPRLNIVGAGRVGCTLGYLLARSGMVVIGDVINRRAQSAATAVAFIGAGRALRAIDESGQADLWLVAVPDDAISPCAEQIAAHCVRTNWPAASAWHCSGFRPAQALGALRPLGWTIASAHPVLSFASPQSAIKQFDRTPCGLEGDRAALQRIRGLLDAIGAQCFELRGDAKPLYHAGAVFATNFVVVAQALAQQAWRDSGVDESMVGRLTEVLLSNCAANVIALGPQRALTGPASRGDTAVVDAQARVVSHWHPQAGRAYRALSAIAADIAAARERHD